MKAHTHMRTSMQGVATYYTYTDRQTCRHKHTFTRHVSLHTHTHTHTHNT